MPIRVDDGPKYTSPIQCAFPTQETWACSGFKIYWYNLREAFGLPRLNRKTRKREKLLARGTWNRR